MTDYEIIKLNKKPNPKLISSFISEIRKNYPILKNFIGFYISKNDMHYVEGDMENFACEISASDMLDLKKNYSILYNKYSVKENNWFALEYDIKPIKGPIIIIKKDQHNFKYDTFFKIYKKKYTSIECNNKNCYEIIKLNDEKQGLCNFCYNFCKIENINLRRKKI